MIKRCTTCLYPDTKPDLKFENGVCSACINAEYKKTIPWINREFELNELLGKYRGNKPWDCIIPVSGGKDSHFITYVLKKKKMNPLLVCFVPSDQTELGRKNLENIKKAFDVDCIEFFAKPSEYLSLQKKGLMELGDHAYPEHLGIFSIPFLIAQSMGIKLLVWGENPTMEYGGTEKKDDQFTEGLFKDEIKTPDNPVFSTTKPEHIKSIFLGDYIRWDAKSQVELVKRYGFTTHNGPMEWTFLDYENLDTKFVAIHDYFKFLKYGYGRATDQASIEIHHGRMSREEGMKMVEKYDSTIPTIHLMEFVKEMGISLKEFNELREKFRK